MMLFMAAVNISAHKPFDAVPLCHESEKDVF